MSRRVLNLLLTHQGGAAIERMLAWWCGHVPPDDILVVFNGPEEVFAALPHPP